MNERVPWEHRLWSKIDQASPGGCWLWTGGLDAYGYGYIRIGGRAGSNVKTHRLVYEQVVGPIPQGLTIDHLCRVRHCVNPAHLEAVSSRENTLRGAKATQRACQRGHAFDADNTIIRSDGRRACRECANANSRERWTARHGHRPQSSKTHCPAGHLLVAPNLRAEKLRDGHRACLACQRGRACARRRGVTASAELQAILDQYYRDIMGVAVIDGPAPVSGGSQ